MSDTVFYGGPDDEELYCTDPDEYVDEFLSNYWQPEEPFPATVLVCEYRPRAIAWRWYPQNVLERLIEDLDDEFGPPGGSEITADMRTAAFLFVERIRRQYRVWSCDMVSEQTVNARDWVRENRPEWLEIDKSGE